MTPHPPPPPLPLLLAEFPALLRRPFWARACRRIAAAHRGDGRRVIVIPGFLAGDLLTLRLRRTLDRAGYRAEGWGSGINWGVRRDLIDQTVARLDRPDAGKVVLIGWSLGGLYAREVAKLRPDRVERVVTLGTPFSGDLHANHAWRLYELVNRHPVDRPPIDVDLSVKPPVPTFALWSPRDGIVAPAASRGQPDESDYRIEVDCRHMDFCSSPRAIEAILEALSAGTAPPPPPARASDGRSLGR